MREGKGGITIVPTPIGNVGDMTLRAMEALREADAVFAEDTRVTGSLLSALGIKKRLERLDENLMGAGAAGAVERAAAGERIAYCSDAGMPGVSDPGLRLVAAARAAGVAVDVLPGASAAITAYVASGTGCPRFYFGGFFPKKPAERSRLLGSLRSLDAALIFYESPNRIASALEAMGEAFPGREVAVCRELTKLHEEVVRGDCRKVLSDLERRFQGGRIKGEIVVVIDPPDGSDQAPDEDSAWDRARQLASQGATAKDICRALRHELGMPRNAAYDMAVRAIDG